jgi:hypothetical protein
LGRGSCKAIGPLPQVVQLLADAVPKTSETLTLRFVSMESAAPKKGRKPAG